MSFGLTGAAIVVAGFGLVKLARTDVGVAIVLATVWVLPFALSLGISLTLSPVFLDRTLLATSLPFFVLLDIGICAILPRRPIVAPATAVGISCLSTANFFAMPPRRRRSARL